MDFSVNERAIITLILKPGELTYPLKIDISQVKLKASPKISIPNIEKERKEVLSYLDNAYFIYYRPNYWTPALRIEFIADKEFLRQNLKQLSLILQAVKYQSGLRGALELYPLFLADKMVKDLGNGLELLREATLRKVLEQYECDTAEIFFYMNSYRTEG